MIHQIDDEKVARYNVLQLMLDEKFKEAESLLNSYVRLRVMDKSYSDFYYRILEAIHVSRASMPKYATQPMPPSFSGELGGSVPGGSSVTSSLV